jgi:radical SAM family uncharacterized protein/radical SAM-linked protein
MSNLEAKWFSGIQRPSRYLGGEVNAVKKDPRSVEVSVALAFPDIYEVGMSHLGLKILYHILNHQSWVAAERVFCPWVDLETELRNRDLPLASLESERPLSEFEVVGFSLQHELSLTNVLTMLNLAGIPFLSEERLRALPLVIAGGPACFNPEPFAAIFDAILVGDGEEAVLEICGAVREAKRLNIPKEQLLALLSGIRGVYVPKFFEAHYLPEGTISGIEAELAGYRGVKKALIPDINRYPPPDRQVVPYAELIHDRLALEISRGCTRGCRFCQAGMIYRPVRERAPLSLIESAEKGLDFTGFEEISLLSLSSGDYSCLGSVMKALMDRQAKGKVALSLPSLRVDSLDPGWFEEIKRVRKTGFTLAPEGGNDRIRKIINKRMTNQEILGMVQEIFAAGWELIKLYFMIGLPGEGEDDVRDIARLANEVARRAGKRGKVNASVAAFVPKAHTPFMWMPQISVEESRRRMNMIRSELRNSRVRLKWNDPEMSWLEGVFSRGDRRLTKSLIRAWEQGARYDAWSEHFNLSRWVEAFRDTGIDPAFYLYRQRSLDEILPWDLIDCGVSREFLLRERRKALEGQVTPDCRERCLECGVCDHGSVSPVLFDSWEPPITAEETPVPAKSIVRYRLVLTKTGPVRYLSHLELIRLIIRALKRARIPLVYSSGYHPMPKISFATALPVGTESLHETLDMQVYDSESPSVVEERLASQLPAGIRVLSIKQLPRDWKSPRPVESIYEISLNGLRAEKGDLTKFLQSQFCLMTKKGKKGERSIDVRSLVKSMDILDSGRVRLVLCHAKGAEIRPSEIVKRVFHLGEESVLKVLKTEEVVE